MSRIQYSQMSGARSATALNAALAAIQAGTTALNYENILPDSMDRLVLPARPVWEVLSSLEISTRNAATLTTVTSPSWATLVHDGHNLSFNFTAYSLGANDALRFRSWISWETTPSAGQGIQGTVSLRWFRDDTSAKLSASGGSIQRDASGTSGNQHGYTYIEGYIEGPATLNANILVQYQYPTGGDAFVSRSITGLDLIKNREAL